MILKRGKGPFRLKTCMFQFWETPLIISVRIPSMPFPCFVFLRQSQFEIGLPRALLVQLGSLSIPLSADSQGEFFQLLSACSLFSFLFSDFYLLELSLVAQMVQECACDVGDPGSIL